MYLFDDCTEMLMSKQRARENFKADGKHCDGFLKFRLSWGPNAKAKCKSWLNASLSQAVIWKFLFTSRASSSSCVWSRFHATRQKKTRGFCLLAGKTHKQKDQDKRSQKDQEKKRLYLFLNWLKAKLCETTLWKRAPLRCFYFKNRR